MTNRITAVGVLICALLFGSSLAAAPELTIPAGTFDFGFVPRNSTVSHIFWLKSTGSDSVKIVAVEPGCGCTKAPLERDRLAPGDSTRLEVIFNTGMYTGPVFKNPRLQTNEAQPDREIHFQATVLIKPDSTTPITVTPYKIDLPQTGATQQNESRFTLRNVSSIALKPTLIEASTDYFRVSLPATIPAGHSANGVLKLTKKGVQESFEKSFTLQMDDAHKSRFTVPVKHQLRASNQAAGPSADSR